MLKDLKQQVWQANLDLVRAGLVVHTWGNASGMDRSRGLMVIKPSGVPYDEMRPEHMVLVELDSGKVIESKLKPSSDTLTHLVLLRAFPHAGGVVHTHSLFATAWAQARRAVPPLGTTHADYFDGPIPCTRSMTSREIEQNYEANTGHVILEAFRKRDPSACPGVLVSSHGPFAWGPTVGEAVENAVLLEHVARLASETLRVFPSVGAMDRVLLNKHYGRKHGPDAYYGQKPAGTMRDNSKPTKRG